MRALFNNTLVGSRTLPFSLASIYHLAVRPEANLMGSVNVSGETSATVLLAPTQVFDRVVIQEDQLRGQQIRGWKVEWQSAEPGAGWIIFARHYCYSSHPIPSIVLLLCTSGIRPHAICTLYRYCPGGAHTYTAPLTVANAETDLFFALGVARRTARLAS
jgi:hypothetical protein